ncbi:MAG: isoprenylcysteine carboxylmethyltransferase family protein [Gemmatimonadetes bacterium]|nr:isoprenylcysteine carboxylmethyltransferase family protein [Gemmatimonadota bacterium]
MNLRLVLTRLLLLPPVLLALTTGSPYGNGSLLEALIRSAGLVLILAAAGGRIWASAHVAGKKNDVLVTEGPYSLVRNPLYFFSLLGFVGTGLAFGSVALAALFKLVFFTTHWPAIRGEEAELERLFGAEYARYRERVPRLLPRLARPHSGGTLSFETWRLDFALRESMAIPLIFVVAELVRWAKLSGHLPMYFLLP